ncbi:MAG: hypothetical protein PHZ19_07845 [Candidatus Thermoplasmatota archaeon]|nr:hypothetical protein [Candidatus Thermoplasmatota archaeon]
MKYAPSSTTITVIIEEQVIGSQIVLDQESFTVTEGVPFVVTGKLLDENGAPIAGMIVFTLNETELKSVLTDPADGSFFGEMVLEDPGEYLIELRYPGSG